MDEITSKLIEESSKELAKPVSETVGNLALPASKTIGESFSNLFDLVLGSHIKLAREKQIFRQDLNFEEYKKSILQKVESIPEESIIDAPLHVVGPAIDAAKYYIENEELSEMFSELIASAYDSRKIKYVHPSFTEIIKQLSPFDAKNIILFQEEDILPMCEVIVSDSERGHSPLQDYFFIANKEVDMDLNSTSIMNLIRLGLLESPSGSHFTNKEIYEDFYKHDYYIQLENEMNSKIAQGIYPADRKLELKYRILKLTPLGKSFLNVAKK